MLKKLLDGYLDIAEMENAVKLGKDILAELLSAASRLLNSSMELDEFKEIYTKPLDKIILFEEENTGNKFVGGEFKIFLMDSRNFGISYSLYFQDENEKWQKMTAKSNPMDNFYLSPGALQELTEKRTIVYDVETPNEEARKEYEEAKHQQKARPKRIE
ncbi:MAG: hypothetical protein J6M62_02170 [Selenomonadaceae bacterium]|nr:hypothetical protein [Selenomonadaceae bacterium]